MEKLQCIIADDEPIARQILENYIIEIPNLEIAASCKNAFEAMEALKTKPIDILFLDINMPKLSGISMLKILHQKPEVIITTAYSEYAIEGFELSVIDYLLKPFSFERFLQAVLKVQQKKKTVSSTDQAETQTSTADRTALWVKSDKKIIKLNTDEVMHVEAYGNYVKIFTTETILTPQTLSDFLKKTPESFLRIHKSYAINFDKIKLIDGNQVVLQNGTKLPIGKSYRKDVLNKIEKV